MTTVTRCSKSFLAAEKRALDVEAPSVQLTYSTLEMASETCRGAGRRVG